MELRTYWEIITTIIIIALAATSLWFSFETSKSSDQTNKIINDTRNISDDMNVKLSEMNARLNSTNEELAKIENVLNLTNSNVIKLAPDKPKIEFNQMSHQYTFDYGEIQPVCKFFINCSFNPSIEIKENESYSVAYLKIKNTGSRANKFVAKVYKNAKTIVLLGKFSVWGDNFDITFDKLGSIATINIPFVDSTSDIIIWVVINEKDAMGNLTESGIVYAYDEGSGSYNLWL